MAGGNGLRLSIVFLALLLSLRVSYAADGVDPKAASAPAAPLMCFTLHPSDPAKGEAPRSCDSYCAEKGAVCTGVQSHIGPPPACEDGMYKWAGNCRCCRVGP